MNLPWKALTLIPSLPPLSVYVCVSLSVCFFCTPLFPFNMLILVCMHVHTHIKPINTEEAGLPEQTVSPDLFSHFYARQRCLWLRISHSLSLENLENLEGWMFQGYCRGREAVADPYVLSKKLISVVMKKKEKQKLRKTTRAESWRKLPIQFS